MSKFGTKPVASKSGSPLWNQGEGHALLYNLDPANTVYISDDPAVQPGTTNSAQIPPLGSLVVDGNYDIFGQCAAGLTAQVSVVPGGLNFFNLARLIVRTLIIEASAGNGLFVYDAAGALRLAIVAADSVDPGAPGIPSNGVTCHSGLTTFNGHGFAIAHLSITLAAFFQYQDLGASGQGTLFVSIAWATGVDPYSGFSYKNGFFGYDPVFGDNLNGLGGQIALSQLFFTRNMLVKTNGSGSLTNVAPFAQIDAPEQTTAQHSQVQMLGATPDGTTRPNGSAAVGNVSGAANLNPTTQAQWEIQGTTQGTLALVSPTTQPPFVANGVQVWESGLGMLAYVNGHNNGGTVPFSTTAVNVNTVTQAVLTSILFEGIPAGDGDRIGAQYVIEAEGYGVWGSTLQALTIGIRFGAAATNVIGVNIVVPVGDQQISTAFTWEARVKLTLVSNPGLTTATWRASIHVFIQTAGVSNGRVYISGTGTAPGNDVTLDASISESYGVSMSWAAIVGAPTISTSVRTFTRNN